MEVHDRRLAAEAADWFARINDTAVKISVRDEFLWWLFRSPGHVQVFLRIAELYGAIGQLAIAETPAELVKQALNDQTDSTVVALGRASQSMMPPSAARKGRHLTLKIAAGLLLVTSLIVGRMVLDELAKYRHAVTVAGEKSDIAMPDGSALFLNTNTELKMGLFPDERVVEIFRGEATFQVAKDPLRPFIVKTPQAMVRAVGTVFNVRITETRTVVSVIEGKVDVTKRWSPFALADALLHPEDKRSSVSEVLLSLGQQTAVDRRAGVVKETEMPFERAIEWRTGRIFFDDESLGSVVAELNRYFETPIRIEDPRVAGFQIDAVFDVKDRETLLQFLETNQGLRIQRNPDGEIIIRGRPKDWSRLPFRAPKRN